ncbi:hypothetical protein [uncultured Polaribacter sp.]|uniref:hypothetical protein n=1 Tax=uncultured Polaribacter sp. TaxID=174711 RepID=UPI0026299A7C|nr:hypothetical protein [uncultured Polaribacter sp.]
MKNQTVEKGKIIAIISYLPFVGFIIALLMNISSKNSFASFHIRQALGLGIFAFLNKYVIGKILGENLGMGILIFLAILWIIGLIGAIKGEEKSTPLLGGLFQEWFKGI